MKRIHTLTIVLGCLLIGIAAKGQNNWSYSPLFWGDLFSFGDKTRLGIGGSFFAGYAFNDWLSSEVSIGYGEGYVGAKEYQKNYYFTQAGLIDYVKQAPTDRRLGDVYSKVAYTQIGLRVQFGVLQLLSPQESRRFEVEVAPALYAQKFYPRLYEEEKDIKIKDYRTNSNTWDYAIGGDLGLSYKLSSHHSVFFRGGLLWLHNDEFEGIRTQPAWRVSLMGTVAVGMRFHLYN